MWTTSPNVLLLAFLETKCTAGSVSHVISSCPWSKQTDLSHVGFHLPALHVGIVDDDGVGPPVKRLLGCGRKVAKEKQSVKKGNGGNKLRMKRLLQNDVCFPGLCVRAFVLRLPCLWFHSWASPRAAGSY